MAREYDTVTMSEWEVLSQRKPYESVKGEWGPVLAALEAGQIVRIPLHDKDGRDVVRGVLQAARYRGPQFRLDRRFSSDAVYFRKVGG